MIDAQHPVRTRGPATAFKGGRKLHGRTPPLGRWMGRGRAGRQKSNRYRARRPRWCRAGRAAPVWYGVPVGGRPAPRLDASKQRSFGPSAQSSSRCCFIVLAVVVPTSSVSTWRNRRSTGVGVAACGVGRIGGRVRHGPGDEIWGIDRPGSDFRIDRAATSRCGYERWRG